MSESGQPPNNRPPPGPPGQKPQGPARGAPGTPSPGVPRVAPVVPQISPVIPSVAPVAPQARPPAQSPQRPGVPVVPPVAPATTRPPTVPGIAPVIPPVAPAGTPRVPPVAPAVPRVAPAVPPVAPAVPRVAPAVPSISPAVPPVAPAAAPTAPAAPVAKGAVPLNEAQLAELERLVKTLDGLDYYELLGVEKSAAPAEIKRAFYKSSRTWHPDRFYQVADEALKDKVHEVYKRMTEAYALLRDDVKRPKYLADVTGPERAGKLRFTEASEAEAKLQKKKEHEEQIGTTPKGRQFYATGSADMDAGRFAAAERNFKMALTFEPQNARYKERLKEAQDKLLEESRKTGSQFKIR